LGFAPNQRFRLAAHENVAPTSCSTLLFFWQFAIPQRPVRFLILFSARLKSYPDTTSCLTIILQVDQYKWINSMFFDRFNFPELARLPNIVQKAALAGNLSAVMNDNLHQLRCFGCGARISGPEARPDFRCVVCGELFEVEYPGWSQRKGPDRPNAGALKWLWRERRSSAEALDHSGVWRFRELLPILDSFGDAVTLFEGNTPLYHLPRAAKA
jgi:DNA-directed RNA polymerase subunit N (RpoN/RPB10)